MQKSFRIVRIWCQLACYPAIITDLFKGLHYRRIIYISTKQINKTADCAGRKTVIFKMHLSDSAAKNPNPLLRISRLYDVPYIEIRLYTRAAYLINKLLHPSVPVGWSSSLCVSVLFFALILMVLGIIGEYLGKMILILNNTPQYIVRETVNIDVTAYEEKKSIHREDEK